MSWRGEIIGHRGAAGVAPENTVASFEAAIAAGVDRVELDVRRSIDGHAVVFHDATPERFDGERPALPVSRLPLARLRAIDVGLASGRGSARVPSLDETLAALRGRVALNVEIKGNGADGAAVLRLALQSLRRQGWAGDVVLSSFHPSVLRVARAEAPDLPRALLFDARQPFDALESAATLRCEGLHPRHDLVDDGLVRRCRGAGLALRAWTANAPSDLRRLMTLGVDGIVTDHPARAVGLRDEVNG